MLDNHPDTVSLSYPPYAAPTPHLKPRHSHPQLLKRSHKRGFVRENENSATMSGGAIYSDQSLYNADSWGQIISSTFA